MTKNKDAQKSEYIIYYCHFHTKPIDSDTYTKKSNKKKMAKCNAPFLLLIY